MTYTNNYTPNLFYTPISTGNPDSVFNSPFFTNNALEFPYNRTANNFMHQRDNFPRYLNTEVNREPMITNYGRNIYTHEDIPISNRGAIYYRPVNNNNNYITTLPQNYNNNRNNVHYAKVNPIYNNNDIRHVKSKTHTMSVPKNNSFQNRINNINDRTLYANRIPREVIPVPSHTITNNKINKPLINTPNAHNPLINNKNIINMTVPNSNKKQELVNNNNIVNPQDKAKNPIQKQTVNNNNNNNNNLNINNEKDLNDKLPRDNYEKRISNKDNNVQNQNNVNINNVNQNQNNNNINAQNNKNPKIATVTKLSNPHPNIPAPTPTKKKIITDEDYFNIIYKDIGITNLGNTCFINSCLQVLIHCQAFMNKFFGKCRLKGIVNKKDTPISYEFLLICKDMVNTINTGLQCIDIKHFKEVFGEKHTQFAGFLQNDSQEFFRILLEDISTELNEVKQKPVYRTLTNTNRKSKTDREMEFHQNFSQRERSIITELFYAQIITTYSCECQLAIYSFQKILDFPLLLPDKTTNTTIHDLLRIYFQTETIDFENKCERCKKVLKHKKELKISRAPEILILSLQRIDQISRTKNECIVTFPQELDMSEFIDYECYKGGESLYTLYAVINHYGRIDFGHYFSYIKLNDYNSWFNFDDSSVKNIGPKIDNFPYAYALFYIKNKTSPS